MRKNLLLTLILISSAILASGCDGDKPSNTNSQNSPTFQTTATLAVTTPAGWEISKGKIAMGTMENFCNITTSADQEACPAYNQAADPQSGKNNLLSLFTYANGDTSSGISDNKIQALMNEAKYLNETKHQPFIPTIVVYTANLSQGPSLTEADWSTNLVFCLQNFLKTLVDIENNSYTPLNSSGTIASVLINPDYIMELQKVSNNYSPELLPYIDGSIDIDMQSALEDPNIASYLKTLGITAPIPPQVTNDFNGYNYFLNWVMHNVKNISYAWVANSSGNQQYGHQYIQNARYGTPTDDWFPDAKTLTGQIQSNINFLKAHNILNTADPILTPSFMAFDKYGADEFGADPSLNYTQQYSLYNATDWNASLTLMKGISQGLPIMLWQIPGGHIQNDGITSTYNTDGDYDYQYFFGDASLENLVSYGSPIHGAAHGGYEIDTDQSILDFLKMPVGDATNQPYSLAQDNTDSLINDGVFAIMWGATNAAVGVINVDGASPSASNQWLINQINQYYQTH